MIEKTNLNNVCKCTIMKITIVQYQIIAGLKNSSHLLRVITFDTHTTNRIYSLNLFVTVVLNDLIFFFVLSFIIQKVNVWIVSWINSVQ